MAKATAEPAVVKLELTREEANLIKYLTQSDLYRFKSDRTSEVKANIYEALNKVLT